MQTMKIVDVCKCKHYIVHCENKLCTTIEMKKKNKNFSVKKFKYQAMIDGDSYSERINSDN